MFDATEIVIVPTTTDLEVQRHILRAVRAVAERQPIQLGVDVDGVAALAEEGASHKRVKKLRKSLGGRDLIIGVDRLLDMMRTAVNVSGDGTVATIVARSENQFDRAVFESDTPSRSSA